MKVNSFFLLLITLLTSCKEEGPKEITFGPKPIQKYQPVAVSKTNSLPVYMHYMPWFDSPEFGGSWGIHWKMSTKNPNTTDANGKREIASHYYPLIGPYDSQDPDVIEYHLLLMKYAGIDGVLINWYGVEGTNSDIGLLLENSNAIIDLTDEVGVGFGVVLEDRFASGKEQTKNNVSYLSANYYSNAQYIRFDNRPLTLLFGPITIMGESNWNEVLAASPENELFMPLWYNNNAGNAASGQYAWVVSSAASGLTTFYNARSTDSFTGGAAYAGFNDFYEEGGWGEGYFDLAVGTTLLGQTLDLANTHESKLDFLQLVTWNDFGEGTMIEPTEEFGFSFLEQIQEFTGVTYTIVELEMVHELYSRRKEFADDDAIQKKLDQVFYDLVALKLTDARTHLDEIN